MKKYSINKRIVTAVLAASAILGANALAEEPISVIVDDSSLALISVVVDGSTLALDVAPVIENDRTLVPMRAIFEALGADVTWDSETRTASAQLNGDTVQITVDDTVMYKNGTAITLDTPSRIINDRTLVPVRAVSESLNADVDWNAQTKSVIISTKTDIPDTSEPEPDNTGITDPEESQISGLKPELKSAIRYRFEQIGFPQFIFDNSTDIFKLISEDNQTFVDTVEKQWRLEAFNYIKRSSASTGVGIQLHYATASDIPEDFDSVIEKNGLDPSEFIQGVSFTSDPTEKGTEMALVIFIDAAEQYSGCKYIAVVCSPEGQPRYFTFESDMFDSENWYFCEITPESRGTIALMEKSDNDIRNAFSMALYAYDNDIGTAVSMNLSPYSTQ